VLSLCERVAVNITQLVQKECKGLLAPARVALDFKDALAEGFVRVFPKAIVCRSFFHLMQANVKKIRQLHLQLIEIDLSMMFESSFMLKIKVNLTLPSEISLERWTSMLQSTLCISDTRG
jgi:hypothetical protein